MQVRLALFASLFAISPQAFAQPAVDQTPPPEAWTGDATVAQPDLGDAIRAYENVLADLQQNLPDEYTGDRAADYAIRAIALHAAAEALAKRFLAEAEDADGGLRDKAQEIAAQEAEAAAFLKEWLEAHPPVARVEETDTTTTGAAAPVPARP
jgi:hypothetical protein